MRARRPDMIAADIPDRGHIPFLDEPASLAVLRGLCRDAACRMTAKTLPSARRTVYQ